MRKPSAISLLAQFFLENVGRIVTSDQLRDASGGIHSWDRRVRQLREDKHWQILSYHDTADLKPGQYLLKEAPPEIQITFARGMSARIRAEVLDRNGFTCQMCGLCPGDTDPATGRKVRLHLGHIKDKTLGGKDELSNLRALCSTCNQGAKNITGEKPSAVWLLTQIRRAGHEEQAQVLKWLLKKFQRDGESQQ